MQHFDFFFQTQKRQINLFWLNMTVHEENILKKQGSLLGWVGRVSKVKRRKLPQNAKGDISSKWPEAAVSKTSPVFCTLLDLQLLYHTAEKCSAHQCVFALHILMDYLSSGTLLTCLTEMIFGDTTWRKFQPSKVECSQKKLLQTNT